jgi:DHA2 family multidrug resistance protein-like MFS transporter
MPKRGWAVLAISLAVVMSVLDTSMINVAMPAIAHSVGATPAQSIWIANAYQLAAAIALLPVGKLADTFGHRRVYLICLAVFTGASLVCALTHSLPALAAGRFAQGLGTAGIMGVSNALLRFIYPRRLLGRGIGLNGMVVALALVCGPSIASMVLAVADWPWLFTVNLPIGLVLLVIGARALPATATTGQGFDPQSAAMSILTFGGLLLGLDAFAHAQGGLAVVGGLGLGLMSGLMLVRRQTGLASPLLPLDLLSYRPFAVSVAVMFLAAAAQLMAFVSLPFLFREGLHRSQLATGLLFTPWPLMTGLAALLAGALSNRIRPALLCFWGLSVFGGGLILLGALSNRPTTLDIVWRVALCGLGYGLFQPPNSRAMITSAPLERTGNAGAMAATARVSGQAAGAALVALLFRIEPQRGIAFALYVAASLAVLGAVLNLARPAAKRLAALGV